MINLTLRNSNKISFFKLNLLNLCSEPGDTLILSYGYFDESFSSLNLSNLLSNLIINLTKSGTKKVYIIGGQYSIPNFSNLTNKEKIFYITSENKRISMNLANLTTTLIKKLPSYSKIDIKYLYKPHFHAKLAIKFNSNLTDNISILMGSSNLTESSIIESSYIPYYNIESDIFLTNINPIDITFNNDLNFLSFIRSTTPEIFLDVNPSITVQPTITPCDFD